MKRAVLLFALMLSLIGWTEESAEPKRENKRTQCWAMTQSGNRCKRRAAAGRRYCHQHAASVKPKKEQERCRSMTEDGKQCEAKPVKGKSYCEKHLESCGDTGDRVETSQKLGKPQE